jgi:hypothetical protein
MEFMALEITNLRVISAEGEKKRAPGPEASILKIKGSEIQQMLTELQMQALGHYALPYLHEAARCRLARRSSMADMKTTPPRCPATTSMSARPPSTAAPTKSRRTSSRR